MVVWARIAQRIVEGDRIVFVHGDELAVWLRGRPGTVGDQRTAKLTEAVDVSGRAA